MGRSFGDGRALLKKEVTAAEGRRTPNRRRVSRCHPICAKRRGLRQSSGASPPTFFCFFQAEDGIRDTSVTGVQTCALPIYPRTLIDDRVFEPLCRILNAEG